MKIAPVSADLLIKLALGAAAVGVVYFSYKKLTGAAGEAFDAATGFASTTLNPASDQNLIYKGVNAVGAAATGDTSGGWSLGGWIYDITHPDPMAPPISSPAGHTAYWKN